MLPFVVVDDQKDVCDVWNYVKHKKLPYFSCFNNSKHHFDLIYFYV